MPETTANDLICLGVSGGCPGGRTRIAVDAVLTGATNAGARSSMLDLTPENHDTVIRAIGASDAVILGSPVYRASYTADLKALLERIERGLHGESSAPLAGKAVAIVLSGGSAHHFLAADQLRSVLSTFFVSQVLSPALYIESQDFVDGRLRAPAHEIARGHGAALVDLATAVRDSVALRALRPQA